MVQQRGYFLFRIEGEGVPKNWDIVTEKIRHF